MCVTGGFVEDFVHKQASQYSRQTANQSTRQCAEGSFCVPDITAANFNFTVMDELKVTTQIDTMLYVM